MKKKLTFLQKTLHYFNAISNILITYGIALKNVLYILYLLESFSSRLELFSASTNRLMFFSSRSCFAFFLLILSFFIDVLASMRFAMSSSSSWKHFQLRKEMFQINKLFLIFFIPLESSKRLTPSTSSSSVFVAFSPRHFDFEESAVELFPLDPETWVMSFLFSSFRFFANLWDVCLCWGIGSASVSCSPEELTVSESSIFILRGSFNPGAWIKTWTAGLRKGFCGLTS